MKVKSICLIAAAAVASLAASPLPANEIDEPTQQSKFAACAHESKGLKGDEHQRFMSECLKGHGGGGDHREAAHKTSADSSQQNRMKTCNEEAGRKNLHGDERRSFMSSCLKG
jgi:hypothetical protein